MAKNDRLLGDDISAIGGASLPDDLFIQDDASTVPSDDLGQQLYWLQRMNPSVVKFRFGDLDNMDDATKQQLIANFQFALGIGPLKDCVS